MTDIELIIELTRRGLPLRRIAEITGRTRASVSQHLLRARKLDPTIPHIGRTERVYVDFTLPPTTVAYFNQAAKTRGRETYILVVDLLQLIADEDMIDAILDDMEQPT